MTNTIFDPWGGRPKRKEIKAQIISLYRQRKRRNKCLRKTIWKVVNCFPKELLKIINDYDVPLSHTIISTGLSSGVGAVLAFHGNGITYYRFWRHPHLLSYATQLELLNRNTKTTISSISDGGESDFLDCLYRDEISHVLFFWRPCEDSSGFTDKVTQAFPDLADFRSVDTYVAFKWGPRPTPCAFNHAHSPL